MLEPKIIFDDPDFFVVEKPTGWISNEAGTTTNQPVLQTWIKKNFKYPLNGNLEARDGLVHRLDKETSGLILIAKKKETFEALQGQFKDRLVSKTYMALVHGRVDRLEGEIKETVGNIFLVLHGGSGTQEDDIKEVIKARIKRKDRYLSLSLMYFAKATIPITNKTKTKQIPYRFIFLFPMIIQTKSPED